MANVLSLEAKIGPIVTPEASIQKGVILYVEYQDATFNLVSAHRMHAGASMAFRFDRKDADPKHALNHVALYTEFNGVYRASGVRAVVEKRDIYNFGDDLQIRVAPLAEQAVQMMRGFESDGDGPQGVSLYVGEKM